MSVSSRHTIFLTGESKTRSCPCVRPTIWALSPGRPLPRDCWLAGTGLQTICLVAVGQRKKVFMRSVSQTPASGSLGALWTGRRKNNYHPPRFPWRGSCTNLPSPPSSSAHAPLSTWMTWSPPRISGCHPNTWPGSTPSCRQVPSFPIISTPLDGNRPRRFNRM